MTDPTGPAIGEPKRFPQIAVLKLAGIGPARFTGTIAIGLLLSANYIATAMINSTIFSELLGERDRETLTTLIVVLAIVLFVRPLLMMLKEWAVSQLGERMKLTLRDRIVTAIARRGPMRVSRRNSGSTQTLMTDGVEQTQTYYGAYIPQITITVFTGLFVAIWLAQYSVAIAVVQFIAAIIVFAVPRVWDKALAEKGQTHWIAYADLNSEFVDSMMGMTTLKAFNAAESRGRTLARRSTHLLESTLNQLRLSLGETGVSAAIMVLGPAIGLSLGIWEVSRGNLAAHDLFMITLLSAEVFRPLRDLANLWHSGFMGLSASREIEAFLNGPDDVRPGDADGRPATGVQADPGSAVSFRGLGYRYLGADAPSLDAADGDVPAGMSTAIVGGSGSGKSTLLGLMLGMDRPTEGTISFLGRDPAAPGSIDDVAMVPQDPMIFAGTIASNLRDGRADAGEEDMLHALKLAHLDDIGGLRGRDLLAMPVSERGGNLSGGQRQRLAIARALVSAPSILILDESTSALDSSTERATLNAIREEAPGITLILVTHRMDTASMCGHVLVLERGTVTESGSPEALLARGGAFSRLIDESNESILPVPAPGPGDDEGGEIR
ncbi:ABC transporter ATP-binding protein/permease [Corynebacterium sp. 335C]